MTLVVGINFGGVIMGFILGLLGVLWFLYVIAKNTGENLEQQKSILEELRQQRSLGERSRENRATIELAAQSVELHSESNSNAGLVNVNTATIEVLQSLPGVGKVLAQKIVDARPFSTAESLLEIPGISQELLTKLKLSISL